MSIENLYELVLATGANAEITSLFDFKINKDKRFKIVQIFGAPSVEAVKLCLDLKCHIKAEILNRKNEAGELEQVVVYCVYPDNLDMLEYE